MGTLGRKAGGADYERFRAALAVHESSGNPSAVQWDTKAQGLFQFIPSIHAKWIKEETGKELSAYLPQDNSPAEMARSVKEQTEKLFPAYYERELAPFVARARKAGIGSRYSDEQLAAMAHFSGTTGAENFLRTGYDNTLGTVGNPTGGISEYVAVFAKELKQNPEATFAQRSAAAQHYGEYGLGRGVYGNFKSKDIAKTNGSARDRAVKALYKGMPALTFSKEELAENNEPEPARRSPRVSQSTRTSLQSSTPAQASVFKASPDAAANENLVVLAKLQVLRAAIGAGQATDAFLNELRKEGMGA